MLTGIKVAEAIERMGYGKLPSGCHFTALNKDITEAVIIALAEPMPKVYYLREYAGQIVAFKAM